jgi:uncharacterized protein
MELFGYIAILAIGMVLGSIGAGGSMLAIPVLVYVFSVDMVTASAYSLFLVGITSLAGAAIKQRERLIDARAGLLFGVPSVVATFIARKWIVVLIPDVVWTSDSIVFAKNDFLLCVFSVLMVVASVFMVVNKKYVGGEGRRQRTFILMQAGLVVGLVSGLVGMGGGFLILPALMIFARLAFGSAVGTGLIIIAANSLMGFCGDVLNHSINWYFLLPLAGLAIAGLILGDWLDKKLPMRSSWQRSFPWLTLATGAAIFLSEFGRCQGW